MQLSNKYLEQRTWNDFCSSISGFTWLAEPNKVQNTNDSRFFFPRCMIKCEMLLHIFIIVSKL